MNDKIIKQLLKNKELLAEVVEETPVEGVEGYSKVVLDAVKFASIVGLSCGGDEKSLLDPFSVIEEERELKNDVSAPNVKGKRELKIWNAPLILRLEVVALVGSMAGWCRFAY